MTTSCVPADAPSPAAPSGWASARARTTGGTAWTPASWSTCVTSSCARDTCPGCSRGARPPAGGCDATSSSSASARSTGRRPTSPEPGCSSTPARCPPGRRWWRTPTSTCTCCTWSATRGAWPTRSARRCRGPRPAAPTSCTAPRRPSRPCGGRPSSWPSPPCASASRGASRPCATRTSWSTPEGTVRTVVEATGLSVSDTDLAHVTRDGVVLGTHHQVAGNPVRFTTGPVPIRPDQAWRRTLPARDRRTVELLTTGVRRLRGYR